MDIAKPTIRLTESYARWRSSRLGQITDRIETELLFELLGSVAGKTVLDVGCGDGALATNLAQQGAIVTARDPDPAMIESARQRADIAHVRVHLVAGRAERLPFNNGAFDLVLAVTVLCFIKDRE